MIQLKGFSAAAATMLLVVNTQAADVYKADKSHANVGFSVSHLVISNVKGSFADFDATLSLSEGKLTAASAAIKTASITTGDSKRDDHLKGADFFDAEKNPEITFTSKSVEQRDGVDVIVGDLTIHGVSKEIALPYSIKGPVKDPWGNTKLGFAASTTIDRTAYGLTWSKALETGGLVVGNEVAIDIDVEFALQ